MTANRISLTQPQWTGTLERLPSAALLCAVGLLFAVVLAGTQVVENANLSTIAEQPADSASSVKADPRVREGTEITRQLGTFTLVGQRISFTTADGRRRFTALENLLLERIARATADNAKTAQWSVSGVVTEYRGANYLLISHAETKGPAGAD